jgi:ribonuclease P protein component
METLKTSSQFERVKKAGRTWASGPVVLNAAPNGLPITRFGFITGKKIGNAVKRNRARRLIREAIRLRLHLLKTGWDLVWIARGSIVDADAQAVSEAVDEALRRGKLYASPAGETAGAGPRILYEAAAGDLPEKAQVDLMSPGSEGEIG